MTAITGWQDSTGQSSLLPTAVHVWAWRLDDSLATEPNLALLAPDEVRRCLRYRFLPDRLRFATSHGNMRRILAGYLQQSPAALLFTVGNGGKPNLAPSQALQFNLSHSKNFGLLAVASEFEVGVDIEEPRRISRSLAQRHFSRAEVQMLSALRDEDWLAGFLRCWTRKEALLKAEGMGLRLPLDSFDVSLNAADPPALVAVRPPAAFRFLWQLYDVSPDPASIASLAVSGAPSSIQLFRYRPG